MAGKHIQCYKRVVGLINHLMMMPKDPTIAKLFNTYRFADYKDKVIDLLMRVCTVSVRTMEIVKAMEANKRD